MVSTEPRRNGRGPPGPSPIPDEAVRFVHVQFVPIAACEFAAMDQAQMPRVSATWQNRIP
jgi:hypothetical protein